MDTTQQLLAILNDKLLTISLQGMEQFAYNVQAVVDEMTDVASMMAGDYLADPEQMLVVLNNALDQVIDRGSLQVDQVMTNYAEEAAYQVSLIAPDIGFTIDQVASITNTWVSFSASNNYQFIRSIIPPIRADITNIFTQAALEGLGISEIELRLREIGLPWSPTGQFSPGQRAQMIAWAEFSRIRDGIMNQSRIEAGLDHCYNDINEALKTHADECLAATDAGNIPVSEMERVYGRPPRHPRCGCALFYTFSNTFDKSTTTRQLTDLENFGIDVNAAVNRWNDKGSRVNQDKEKWRKNLQWENDLITQLSREA